MLCSRAANLELQRRLVPPSPHNCNNKNMHVFQSVICCRGTVLSRCRIRGVDNQSWVQGGRRCDHNRHNCQNPECHHGHLFVLFFVVLFSCSCLMPYFSHAVCPLLTHPSFCLYLSVSILGHFYSFTQHAPTWVVLIHLPPFLSPSLSFM